MTPTQTDTEILQREMKWPKLTAFESLDLCLCLKMITIEEYWLAHFKISLLQDLGRETKPEEVDTIILEMRNTTPPKGK